MGIQPNPGFDERLKEYVDSPLMTQRLRCESSVSALIAGNFGCYRTRVELKPGNATGECTCPPNLQPCKHICALRATWDKNPASFFNLDDWLAILPRESKTVLIEAIRNMILHSPSLLSVFGVDGFEEEASSEDEYYD